MTTVLLLLHYLDPTILNLPLAPFRTRTMANNTQPEPTPTPSSRGPPLPEPAPQNGPEEDPLETWSLPPMDESSEERVARELLEAEARRRSDAIDEAIKADRAKLKRERREVVKVLLVGQSESGKSTTLKNFRMRYARQAWRAERATWTPVVQLNLVRAIRTICEAVVAEGQSFRQTSSSQALSPRAGSPPVVRTHKSSHSLALSVAALSLADSDATEHSHPSSVTLVPSRPDPVVITETHMALCERLEALNRVEALLVKRLGEASMDDEAPSADSEDGPGVLGEIREVKDETPAALARRRMKRTGDVIVRSWSQASTSDTASPPPGAAPLAEAASSSDAEDERLDINKTLVAHLEDIRQLWNDENVQMLLERRSIRLRKEAGGFFLHEIDRIATLNYEPSDDDIIRARLRTLGPQEYRLKFEGGVLTAGMEMGREWVIYDIGGSRTRRAAWIPFFSEINALIFLAPISCFDEHLVESPSTNRLEDSFLLWRAICASTLLKNATFIVFLNKMDLLEEKLARGVQVVKYLPSYQDRKNEVPVFVKCEWYFCFATFEIEQLTIGSDLKGKFRDMSAQRLPQRILYVYATSVVDTKATGSTLKSG
ncbi:hypothetical protein HWV62_16198 [Athelia sp. TMB]|nr:hypothetical protein HWV62_16198 [Athelia sp. TMB]